MVEPADKLLPPVLAAMSAVDAAVAERDRLVEQLNKAMLEGVRLDEELRQVDFADAATMAVATQAYSFAVSMVQRISWRLETSRRAMERAQEALVLARKSQSLARSELLRIELEIDAASIWDMVGRFEAQLRGRLTEHARIAAEMSFAARAAGEKTATALEASTLEPALGTSGPDLWNALAGGVRLLQDKHGAAPAERPQPVRFAQRLEIAPPIAEVFGERVDRPTRSIPPSVLDALSPAVTPPPAVLARAVRPVEAVRVATPAAVPIARRSTPPPPPRDDEEEASRFDFARPSAAGAKSDPPPPVFLGKVTPPKNTPVRVESQPPAAENKRGRLDKMLRNLAGMVGQPARARRWREK